MPYLLYLHPSDLDYDWKTEELFWSESGDSRVLFKTTTDPTVEPSLSPAINGTITSIAVNPHNKYKHVLFYNMTYGTAILSTRELFCVLNESQ